MFAAPGRFMNFCTVSELAEHVFETDSNGVAWLYSFALLAVLPATAPAACGLVPAAKSQRRVVVL